MRQREEKCLIQTSPEKKSKQKQADEVHVQGRTAA